MFPLWLVAAGYLSGSVPFGVLLTRWFGRTDPRTAGSGNIGATNVARVAGKKLGIAVLLLDAAKGALPVSLALRLYPEAPWVHAAVGLAAFLGHVFPVWLRFRGGKGVATALGLMAVLAPLPTLAGAAVFVALAAALRVVALGSLGGGAAVTAACFLLGRPMETCVLSAALLVLMVFTHRGNLSRIWKHLEPKL